MRDLRPVWIVFSSVGRFRQKHATLRVMFVFLCLLALPFLIHAQTTIIDFDPPAFTAGTTLSTVGDVTFLDGPVVFNSTVAATFSPPNALHSALNCTDVPCSDGAYMLRLNFSKPMSVVSLRAGAYGVNNPNACFPENDPCNINARRRATTGCTRRPACYRVPAWACQNSNPK